ncbi:uncharacterized protein WM277_018196 isoform 2-T4 [Molossus nigricans]
MERLRLPSWVTALREAGGHVTQRPRGETGLIPSHSSSSEWPPPGMPRYAIRSHGKHGKGWDRRQGGDAGERPSH